jgi:hypothetical protein
MLLSALGHVHAIAGKRSDAENILEELQSPSRYVAPVYLALVAAGLGDQPRALTELERGISERSGWLVFLRVDPRFDLLRVDTRFQQILERQTSAGRAFRDSSESTHRRAG